MVSKKNIFVIINSRIFPKKENEETLWRRSVCKDCAWNSKNMEKISFKMKILNCLSNLLNIITFRKTEDLGQCNLPDCGCNIYLKSLEPEENCELGFWSIYIPNSSKSKNGKRK